MAGRHAQPRGWAQRARALTVALCAIAVAVTACDSPVPSGPPSTPTAPAPTAASIATIEISPGAVLLAGAGQTKALSAVARTAEGTVVPATVTWSSADTAVATVDASGTVTAASAVGSSAITASVGDIQSEPAYVTVATPVGGAVLLTDSQIVEGPTAVDPAAEPAPENPYEIVVSGVTGLEPRAIVINTESLPVAGEVVSTTPEGANTRVRIVVVPPGELFDEVEFSDTVDLSEGPFEIPAELAADYDVVRDGSTFTFTPKTGTAAAGSPGSAVLASHVERGGGDDVAAAGIAQGTRALPPFRDCVTDIGGNQPLPLALSVPPTFTFTARGTATREVTAAGTKLVVAATPTFTLETTLEVRASFEAKVTCKATLATRKFRVPGWAGLFFGGDVEFGVGFEVGGRVTLISAKVGGKAELKPTFSATLDCPAGAECGLSGDAALNEPKLTPTLQAPNLNQLRLDPRVNLFGFVTLEAGNADVDQLQFKAIEARAGLELAASMALEGLQIDNTAADGRSKYALAFKGEIGPGVKLGGFLRYMGLSTVVPLKLGFELPLGESPTGTAKADRARYLPGESGTVTVELAAGSTVFPASIGIYNVDRVVVARRDGLTTEVLGSVDASEGQTTFEVPITASGLVDADELFAFVVTSALPLDPPKLELGPASWSCDVEEPLTIESLNDDPDKIYVVFDGESDCRLVAETGDGHFPGDGTNVAVSIDTDPEERAWDGEDSDDESDGQAWDAVSGFGQNIPNGRHTLRSRHVESGTVYQISLTVEVELIGGENTRMTVSEVSISLAP